MNPIVHLDSVSHAYGDGSSRKSVLQSVSLRVDPGEVVILTGPSGSGKTTLLTLVGALRSVQSGSCRVLDHQLMGADERVQNAVRRRVGYIFQAHNLLPFVSALENVALSAALAPDQPDREGCRRRAMELMEAVGLQEQAHQLPSTLSGGQRQRVAIARALAHSPQLVLADEPTAALDKNSGHQAVSLLRELTHQRGTSVLLVTHDSRILDVADRTLHVEDGRLEA